VAVAADPGWRWLYRVGGAAALALGAAYLATIPLYASVGAPPRGGEAWLSYAAGKTGVWWAILWLSVLTDLLFLPVSFALFAALAAVHRGAALIGTSLLLLFAVLDLAVTWSSYGALIRLAEGHAAATTEAQRLATVAAAEYASASLAFGLGTYSILVPSLGILVVGLVMLGGVFGKGIAYLGVGTGILGVVSVVGPLVASALGATIILTSVLTAVWVLLVGVRLYRLATVRI